MLTTWRSRFVGEDLRDVVVTSKGLLVSHFRSAIVDVLDGAGNVIAHAGPAAATSNGVTAFQPTVAWRMVPTSDGGALLVHQASRSDVLPISDFAPQFASAASNDALGSTPGTPPSGYTSGTCGLDFVHTQLSKLGPDGSPQAPPGIGSLQEMPVSIDVAISRGGEFAAVLSAGGGRIQEALIDQVTSTDPCGNDPGSANPDRGGDALPVGVGRLVPTDIDPIALAYGADDGLIVQLREPSTLEIHDPATGSVQARIDLGGPSRADTALTMFQMTADLTPRGIACASCHPEGHDDGHVWAFSDGPKRTQSLAAFSAATAPFHWRGDIGDMGLLVDDIFTGRMGGSKQSTAAKNALLDWLEQIPEEPHTARIDPASAERGRAIFENPYVGCSTCHSGPLLTNNTTVDVGTGGRFQVPSLKGVGGRAPYMHTGCAATLRDRFDPACGGEAHGDIVGLTDSQIADLVAYLETL